MKHVRLRLLVASAFTLLVAACSQLPTPQAQSDSLTPQFGTAGEDYGIAVANAPSQSVYALAEQRSLYYAEDGVYEDAVLRRFDSRGNLSWSRKVESGACENCYDDFSLRTRTLAADTRGYTYSLIAFYGTAGDCANTIIYNIYKYDASGKFVRWFRLGSSGQGFESEAVPTDAIDIAVDNSGNLYTVRQEANFFDEYCNSTLKDVVAKYSATGKLQWQHTSAVGTLSSVSVSAGGDIYVAGSGGVTRYTSGGKLSWTKTGKATDIVATGKNTVYARNLGTIRKLDASGKQLWSKTQGGLSGMVVADMVSNDDANLYLTGKYSASKGNRDVFTRKLSSSGKTLWTQTFGTSAYDAASGVTTVDGNEIYLIGSTQGDLAHPNAGGSDGFLRKLGSRGDSVWTR